MFKAQHRESGTLVAIKRFKQSEDADTHVNKTMQREIKVLESYKNQHIVLLHTVFRQHKRLHLVFEYESRNLLEELQSKNGKGIEPVKIRSIVY